MKTYEFRDIFIKKCEIKDGVGDCKKYRESIKCVDDICKKIDYNKRPAKKEILYEYYNGNDNATNNVKDNGNDNVKDNGNDNGNDNGKDNVKDNVKDNTIPYSFLKNQSGQGQVREKKVKSVNKLKNKLISNLKKKYKCTFCGKYKYMEKMIEHIKSHDIKQNGGCANCMIGGCAACIGGGCVTCNKKKSMIRPVGNKLIGGGNIRSQFYGKKSSVNVKVPLSVKNTALYAFKLSKLGFKGGRETGWKRAKQLATKETIPIEDLRYMKAWFARHVYTSYPGYNKWVKAGRPKDIKWHNKHAIISWLIWSGDAAFKWVNSTKNINLLNKHYHNKNYKKIKLPKL